MDKNKDPAFLFYSSDFLTGTMFFTDEQVGKYIRLLCAQHQKGHLKEKDMLNICRTYDEDIFSKFMQDEEGLYYNQRLELETNKRQKYAESRRNNRLSSKNKQEKNDNICQTYDETYVKHMEIENENINEDIITSNVINKDTINTFFETLWKLYPKKEGKGGVSEAQKKKLYNIGLEEMTRAIDRYIKAKQGTDRKYMKNGSTFFNSGYVDYLDANYEEVRNENTRHNTRTETGIGDETDEAYDYNKFFA